MDNEIENEAVTVDLENLRRRFPDYTIRSQPAPGCACIDGVRKTEMGREFPCLCVCLSAPSPGEEEYRDDALKALGTAAKKALGNGSTN